MIAAPGHTPTSPVTMDGPRFVTVEPPRIPKLQAVFNGTMGIQAVADVVKVHTKLLGNGSPARDSAPVVMVAVYKVFSARALFGVKVATSLDAT